METTAATKAVASPREGHVPAVARGSSRPVQLSETDAHYGPRVERARSLTAGQDVPSDAQSPEDYLAGVDAERLRLRSEIESARARVEAAQDRVTARTEEARRALRELVAAAQRELDEMDREHQQAIRSVRTAAEAQAARILADARAETDPALVVGPDRPPMPHAE